MIPLWTAFGWWTRVAQNDLMKLVVMGSVGDGAFRKAVSPLR
jgi:hypothetical protein